MRLNAHMNPNPNPTYYLYTYISMRLNAHLNPNPKLLVFKQNTSGICTSMRHHALLICNPNPNLFKLI